MRTGYGAEQPLPQCKMGLNAQEQLAKSYIACDMQDRGGCEVVELESVELQEPAEERMYWESESPYQIRDEAYSLPLLGLGVASACLPP